MLAVCLLIIGLSTVVFYRFKRSGIGRNLVSCDILNMLDTSMDDRDPTAIHIMQIIIGPRAVRFHVIFMKSMLWHHFERGASRAAPIHLHLLTDNATRHILEGVLGSWRINNLRFTFYSAEPYQAKIGWMKSNHPATKYATLKMYIPEIFNSSVTKVILLDTDCLFLADVAYLWHHFSLFKPLQFLGMAPEQFDVMYDMRRLGGRLQWLSYNGGVTMWYLQRLTMEKWDMIWKPSYSRALKLFGTLSAAEQTLLTVAAMDNPDILYPLPCTWNFQLYAQVNVDRCPSTWSHPNGPDIHEPRLVHANMPTKLETNFSLEQPKHLATNVDDLVARYVALRSRFNILDGYELRHSPISVPEFSFNYLMQSLHPDGKMLNKHVLCRSKWSSLGWLCERPNSPTFTAHHRIHPHFASNDYNALTANAPGVTLAIDLAITDIWKLIHLTSEWKGSMSVAVYGGDEDALSCLTFVENFGLFSNRTNIIIHYVYSNKSFPESVTLHNTAVVYAPTQSILLVPHLDIALSSLETLTNTLSADSPTDSFVIMDSTADVNCQHPDNNLCAVNLKNVDKSNEVMKEKIQGLLIRTGSSLLPAELEEADRATHLLALIANSLF